MTGEMEPPAAGERDRSRRIFGVLLIVAGVLMLVGRMDLPEPWHLHGLWPVLIIALGVARFWSQPTGRRRGTGLGMIGAGVLLLLHVQDIVSLAVSWPLFVVFAGISIFVSAWGASARSIDGGQP